MAAPYQRIATQLRTQIERGDLAPGDRVPSTRQIVDHHGVAMATAARALTQLRADGLVETIRGVGTVVSPEAAPARIRSGVTGELASSAIVAAAMEIADRDGLDAVSMRRVAGELGTSAMSLYRHVPAKEDLLLSMREAAFAEQPPPRAAEEGGWRLALEQAARALWSIYRRHPWLAATTSLTRPVAGPHQVAYSEWILSALRAAGVGRRDAFHLHLTLFGHVHGFAASLHAEQRQTAETGVTKEVWLASRRSEAHAMLTSGTFPASGEVFTAPEVNLDLDELFGFGLARLLDGYATLIDG
jgi:DNA-binding transcriptional regulator YhcF (GntR family)